MTIILAQLVLIAIIGYLWGSIPSGYWMGKLLRGKDFDIRNYGSHKTGATNVRRTLGNGPAPLTFLISAITTISTIVISRFVSLGSIVGAMTSIICGIVFYFVGRANPTFFGRVSLAQMILLVVVPGLVILFHYDNIGRLLAGKERKLGQKEVVASSSNATPDVQA